MMAAPITVSGSTLEPGAPVLLFPTRIVGGGVDLLQGRQYDVAPDGRFLINTELDTAAAPITLLMNWNPDEEGTPVERCLLLLRLAKAERRHGFHAVEAATWVIWVALGCKLSATLSRMTRGDVRRGRGRRATLRSPLSFLSCSRR